MAEKKYEEINLAKLVKNEDGEYVALNTDNLDPSNDLNRLLFLFEHKDGKIVVNLEDVLCCLKIAEENHYLPESSQEWWNGAYALTNYGKFQKGD